MPSERQQAITIAQVRNKMHDARMRTIHHMERALEAKSEEVYESNLRWAVKAASDYEIWKKVLTSFN